jgi:hypothetical protein
MSENIKAYEDLRQRLVDARVKLAELRQRDARHAIQDRGRVALGILFAAEDELTRMIIEATEEGRK